MKDMKYWKSEELKLEKEFFDVIDSNLVAKDNDDLDWEHFNDYAMYIEDQVKEIVFNEALLKSRNMDSSSFKLVSVDEKNQEFTISINDVSHKMIVTYLEDDDMYAMQTEDSICKEAI